MNKKYDIGVEIRKILAEKKENIKWLSKQTDIDNSNLAKMLKGERQILDYQIVRISMVLGKNLYHFFAHNLDIDMANYLKGVAGKSLNDNQLKNEKKMWSN
ncbi:MAG: hypothetical protein FWH18_07635 [Marinilabiliaceae bacterium]|nr:hypothetical protein [Marinilabiliaceae bacterium]